MIAQGFRTFKVPVKGIRRYDEQKRHRWLQDEDHAMCEDYRAGATFDFALDAEASTYSSRAPGG